MFVVRGTSSGYERASCQQKARRGEGQDGNRPYGDDLAQALKHLAVIATVKELLDLCPVQGTGCVPRVSGGGGGIEGKFLGCAGLSVSLAKVLEGD